MGACKRLYPGASRGFGREAAASASSSLAGRTEIAGIHAELQKTRATLKADIVGINAPIETIQADLLRWMIGALIALGGVLAAVIKAGAGAHLLDFLGLIS